MDRIQYISLIQTTKAKCLRKCIQSLDELCLKQILTTFINNHFNHSTNDHSPLTTTQTLHKWIATEPEPKPNHPSKQILFAIDSYCTPKRFENKMYQKQSELLAQMPVILTANTFSFLSFSELSRIETVCRYFLQSSRKYKAISHYHLDINVAFVNKAFSNQVDMQLLSHFKSINVSAAYLGGWGCGVASGKLYRKILEWIAVHSQTSLQCLIIDIKNSYGSGCDYYVTRAGNSLVLDTIFKANGTFPVLETIEWAKVANPWNPYADCFVERFVTKLPSLKSISLTNRYSNRYMYGHHDDLIVKLFRRRPVSWTRRLKCVHIEYTQLLQFAPFLELMQQNMPHLEDLSLELRISNLMNAQNKLKLLPNQCLEKNASVILQKQDVYPKQNVLKRLEITLLSEAVQVLLTMEAGDHPLSMIHRTLAYVILLYPNITELKLKTSKYISLNWFLLLDLLYANKRQSDADPLTRLSVHELDCNDLEQLVRGLSNPVHMQQFKCLQYIDLGIQMNEREKLKEELSDIMQEQIIPLLKQHANIGGALQSLDLSIGSYHHSDYYAWDYWNLKKEEHWHCYYESILSLLQNIPSALRILKLEFRDTSKSLKPHSSKETNMY